MGTVLTASWKDECASQCLRAAWRDLVSEDGHMKRGSTSSGSAASSTSLDTSTTGGGGKGGPSALDPDASDCLSERGHPPTPPLLPALPLRAGLPSLPSFFPPPPPPGETALGGSEHSGPLPPAPPSGGSSLARLGWRSGSGVAREAWRSSALSSLDTVMSSTQQCGRGVKCTEDMEDDAEEARDVAERAEQADSGRGSPGCSFFL